MFVLIALESIYFSQKRQMPTQLAAARVDEKWQPMEVFATLFHPMGGMRVDFNNPAFSGASASDYLSAPPAYMVLNAFAAWLKQDDVLCFWQADTRSLLQSFMRIILKSQ